MEIYTLIHGEKQKYEATSNERKREKRSRALAGYVGREGKKMKASVHFHNKNEV